MQPTLVSAVPAYVVRAASGVSASAAQAQVGAVLTLPSRLGTGRSVRVLRSSCSCAQRSCGGAVVAAQTTIKLRLSMINNQHQGSEHAFGVEDGERAVMLRVSVQRAGSSHVWARTCGVERTGAGTAVLESTAWRDGERTSHRCKSSLSLCALSVFMRRIRATSRYPMVVLASYLCNRKRTIVSTTQTCSVLRRECQDRSSEQRRHEQCSKQRASAAVTAGERAGGCEPESFCSSRRQSRPPGRSGWC